MAAEWRTVSIMSAQPGWRAWYADSNGNPRLMDVPLWLVQERGQERRVVAGTVCGGTPEVYPAHETPHAGFVAIVSPNFPAEKILPVPPAYGAPA